jgi:hypothetical protein
MIYRFDRFAGNQKISSSINMLLAIYISLMLVILVFRLPYSIKILMTGFVISGIQLSLMIKANVNKSRLNLALIPCGITDRFKSIKPHKFSLLSETLTL